MKLILIDDETHTRHGILQRVNWTDLGIRSVRAVSGAREALALCQDWIPDIVLSDIRMPEMDGVTLCRKLRQLAPESTLPIREETFVKNPFLQARDISIHSSHTGRDSKRIQPFCTKSCCICTT